ncbi:hypothetical protein ACFV1L_30380 [Kitasatospora sp. NPDC059646]|uniref:hypothetical protein n=1 Tax=Kitasatospora sp. NPDC059646 TaxID=3346893 RepID=UPI0036A8A5BF
MPRPRPTAEPRDWSTPDQRWTLLDRCLNDDALPLDVRAAGSLILLYGINGQRITELTTRHLTGGTQPTIQLDDHPAALPPAAFHLLAQQAEHAVTASAIARASARPSTPWLFPSQLADQAVTAHCLTRKLRHHGLPVIPWPAPARSRKAACVGAAVRGRSRRDRMGRPDTAGARQLLRHWRGTAAQLFGMAAGRFPRPEASVLLGRIAGCGAPPSVLHALTAARGLLRGRLWARAYTTTLTSLSLAATLPAAVQLWALAHPQREGFLTREPADVATPLAVLLALAAVNAAVLYATALSPRTSHWYTHAH